LSYFFGKKTLLIFASLIIIGLGLLDVAKMFMSNERKINQAPLTLVNIDFYTGMKCINGKIISNLFGLPEKSFVTPSVVTSTKLKKSKKVKRVSHNTLCIGRNCVTLVAVARVDGEKLAFFLHKRKNKLFKRKKGDVVMDDIKVVDIAERNVTVGGDLVYKLSLF
jgi:hypothetical protein